MPRDLAGHRNPPDTAAAPHTHPTLRLQPDVGAPRRARASLNEFCSDHVPADALGTATLLLSELVTNACQHGQGVITVAIACDGESLGIAVSDNSPDLPVIRDVAPTADHGRGMLLLDALAESWGIWPGRQPAHQTKTVWFHT